jgi:excisionase family DNA binding protein
VPDNARNASPTHLVVPEETPVSALPRQTGQPRIVLTVAEAAAVLSIGRTLMYSLVSSGAVESVTIGRLRRVPTDALTAYIATLRANGKSGGVAA